MRSICRFNLIHLDAGVTVIHVADVQVHEIQQLPTLLRRKVRDARARVVDHDVVLERFGQVVVLGFVGVEDGLRALHRLFSASNMSRPRFCSS